MNSDGGYGSGKGMGFLKPKSRRKPAARKRELPSLFEYSQNASPSKVMFFHSNAQEKKLGQAFHGSHTMMS
jgi:hypothetical protein